MAENLLKWAKIKIHTVFYLEIRIQLKAVNTSACSVSETWIRLKQLSRIMVRAFYLRSYISNVKQVIYYILTKNYNIAIIYLSFSVKFDKIQQKGSFVITYERRQSLLEILRKQPGLRVPELAKALDVSEGTVRNDLNALEGEGRLKRVHGGAILNGQVISK